MYQRKIKEDLDCGINVSMKVFGAKWKPCIIDAIAKGIRRPSEIQRTIAISSLRVIEMQLSELLGFGIVFKEVSSGFPLKVEYYLTDLGKSILPIISQLNKWGNQNKNLVKETVELQNQELVEN
jgi:DNA-binding HxlR family transcriptional regulator